ncbi:acyl-CoA-binding domain-containing protein 6 isoform 27-T33 [Alca torda]
MASPPLVVAGAGSGGEASSGSEETGTAALPGRDLAALFEQAAERLPALLPAASKEQLLYLYARYKQTAEKRGKESKTAFGGPVVSSLYQEETIREEDKNIFDYCRENNIDYVTKAIRSKKVDVNVTDEEQRQGPWVGCFGRARGVSFWGLGDLGSIENLTLNCGRALLHWACDRGHKELVSVLLQHAADVNSQEDSMHGRKHKHQFIIYCSNPRRGRAQRLMRDDVLFKFGTWKRKGMALNRNVSDERMKPKHALNFMFLSFYYLGSK